MFFYMCNQLDRNDFRIVEMFWSGRSSFLLRRDRSSDSDGAMALIHFGFPLKIHGESPARRSSVIPGATTIGWKIVSASVRGPHARRARSQTAIEPFARRCLAEGR
jgi:hypothetical protein